MPPTVLTIAGFDPSAGAGVGADLKTIAALGFYGVGVVTAVTAQNTRGVQAIYPIPPQMIAQQIESIVADVEVRAVKVGMLGTAGAVEVVATLVEAYDLPNLVVDPVLRSGSGTELLEEGGAEALRARLFPRAVVVTPNLEEAAQLTGRPVRDLASMKEAARQLRRMGARGALVTGGHLPGRAVDVLLDGDEFALFDGSRVPVPGAHGLGCAFSSAVACGLARGFTLVQAVDDAKRYVSRALAGSRRVGRGSPLLDHGARFDAPPGGGGSVTNRSGR